VDGSPVKVYTEDAWTYAHLIAAIEGSAQAPRAVQFLGPEGKEEHLQLGAAARRGEEPPPRTFARLGMKKGDDRLAM